MFTCRLIFTKLVDRAGNQTDTTYWSQIVKTMAITFKGERKIQTRILKKIKQFKVMIVNALTLKWHISTIIFSHSCNH